MDRADIVRDFAAVQQNTMNSNSSVKTNSIVNLFEFS
jgi:hypothetical protein